MHQPHDVGLVERERLRQRRLQPDHAGGVHDRVDLLGAADVEQPREVADLARAGKREASDGRHAESLTQKPVAHALVV